MEVTIKKIVPFSKSLGLEMQRFSAPFVPTMGRLVNDTEDISRSLIFLYITCILTFGIHISVYFTLIIYRI